MQAKNILVATDFSGPSEVALQLATSLARETGAVIHIVHVQKPHTLYRVDSKYGEIPPFPKLDELKPALEKVVPSDPKVSCRHWLLSSDYVAKKILQLADETHADLIMMGTHGRTGISRMLMGSVAAEVVRHATCPVLTIKHPLLELVEPAEDSSSS
jgi:nucleotide-binding universal stress UspA family protein